MADRADIQTEMDLLATLEGGEAVTQLALSKRLSVSVGLVNALLKRAAKKGQAKARAVPPRRWAYYLTPKGFAEKSRLVATYLDSSLAFFREARAEYVELFARLRALGIRRVVLVGRGELAEIAILAAIETGMEIVGLLDPESNNERLYGMPVLRRLDESEDSAALVITDSREPQAAFDKVRANYETRRIEAPTLLRVSTGPLQGARP
jgi:DNA-binding MarR family transcriptional regulator